MQFPHQPNCVALQNRSAIAEPQGGIGRFIAAIAFKFEYQSKQFTNGGVGIIAKEAIHGRACP